MGKASNPRCSKKERKARGRSNPGAGRPRKEGPRYANGRLKPEGPNARVVEIRRALLGKPDAKGMALAPAENPLALAHARGWLSKSLLDAGAAFREHHHKARLSLPPPRTANLEPGSGGKSYAPADPAALYLMHRIWTVLSIKPKALGAVVDVCILDAWPDWLVQAVAEPAVDRRARILQSARRAHLQEGLAVIASILSQPLPQGIQRGTELSEFVSWLRIGKGTADALGRALAA